MTDYKVPINRSLVGVLALICLTAWIGIWSIWPDSEEWKMWQAGFMRVGLVMSAFWLALPGRNRPAAWTNVSPGIFVGLILAVAGIAVRPRLVIPLLVVVSVIGFFLRPRERGPRMAPRRKPRPPRSTTSDNRPPDPPPAQPAEVADSGRSSGPQD